MNLWSAISLGFKEIWAHKFRSCLTMLGIILGVSSLVAMSALTTGMEKGMKEALIAIGGLQKIRVEPQELPIEQRHLRDQAPGVTLDDLKAIRASAPLIHEISPEMRLGRAIVSANGKTIRPFMLSGVWPEAIAMNEHVVEHGRMFNEIDDEMARSVCVIGTETRDELFGSPEKVGREIIPLGETIYINTVPFTIIGMFQHYESEMAKKMRELKAMEPKVAPVPGAPKRDRGWGGGRAGGFIFYIKNAMIYIPLNTMWIKLKSGSGMQSGASVTGTPKLDNLQLKIGDIETLTPAIQQVHNVLMSSHKGIEDFTFRTQEDWADQIATQIRNARLSGGMIAAISLLVGGIGIMNIMLASITERVREIGIRKSVGATTFDIFVQIVVESMVIALVGGLMGLVTSFGLVQLLRTLSPTDNAPLITPIAMLTAFAFSALIGVLAGLIPAVKASRLHPIQALRYD